MSRWRLILIWTLLTLPWVVILAVALYAVWLRGWAMWIWLPIAVCWGTALLLLRSGRTRLRLFGRPQFDTLPRWSPRDSEAWSLVDARATAVDQVDPNQLLRPQFYFDTAMELAKQVARVYHPKADDPVANLTLPEILAAIELASEDLAEITHRYLPAGHLLTIKHWRRIAAFPGWYQRFATIYWPLTAVFAPATVIARYATSKMIISPVTQLLQDNVLSWFYACFVHRLGYYLIELNSGRLAGGADRFRTLMDQLNEGFDEMGMPTRGAGAGPAKSSVAPAAETIPSGDPSAPTTDPLTAPIEVPPAATEIVICLIGQSKAGKSSLINALLGEQQAAVDVIPQTDTIRRHTTTRHQTRDSLVLLDTVGFEAHGFSDSQKVDLHHALRESDLVLLVMNVTNPARESDIRWLTELTAWFQQRRDLKPVPIVGVVTHVDLLRPTREWEPPYDWQLGSRPKERSIREAVEYHRQLLGNRVAGVVPVCTDVQRERVFGVEEFLVPAMMPLLGEARSASLLRTLHRELSQRHATRVVHQFWEVGKRLVRAASGDRSPNRPIT